MNTSKSSIELKSSVDGRTIVISSYTDVRNIEGHLNIAIGNDNITIPYRDINKLVKSIRHLLEVLEFPSDY